MVFALQPGERALAVATHMDDEVLGAGGTIARMVASGIDVDVLAVTCCTHPGSDPVERTREFTEACAVLGVYAHHVAWVDTDRARDPASHLYDLVQLIETGPDVSLAASQPAVLLIPAAGSFHQDHRAVHEASIAAARPGGSGRPTPRIVLGYRGPEDEVWGRSAEPRSVVVDTSPYAEIKDKALECYGTQLRAAPHPRSIEIIHALDVRAGAAIGTAAAEMFVPYRMAL
jgi:LmbE family N-acetylglucosaminyl deacetylase